MKGRLQRITPENGRELYLRFYTRFFVSLCAAHFDSGSDQIGLVFGFMGYP